MEITKAVVPVAGLGTRFLPLSKVLPKELWPLVDKPVIQYILEEARDSGIKKIIFVTRPEKRMIIDYVSGEMKLSLAEVLQKKPLGDGHAILQAEKIVAKTPFAAAMGDDVIDSKTPCFDQLAKVFKKYKGPVIALAKIPKQSFPFYGMVGVKKIEKNVYQIIKILEKPEIKESPSNLAIVGRYVLTPEIFSDLKKAKPNKKGEIILAEVLAEKVKRGEKLYGCEFEGKWLECGSKEKFVQSFLYLAKK